MPSLPSRIINRNNEIVNFKREKILNAIREAFESQNINNIKKIHSATNKVICKLSKKYHQRSIPAIEGIQDLVEQTLMTEGYPEVAKAYILYREQHTKTRKDKDLLLDIEKTMEGYLDRGDWRVKENSSVNYSLGGLILHNSGTITANYWLNHIYEKKIAKAHIDGDFHIHDLSMFSGYCAGWSLKQLLEIGFEGIEGKISSKPAKHLSTAISQIINFLGTMQNEWAGAQAFSSFDTYLAPFVKIDNLSYEEVKQNIQSFVFSVNTPSRWGSQSPFSNITLDWIVPNDLENKKTIVGGIRVDFTYGECQEEMNLINKAFLEVMFEGDANGRGFSYPIPTYNITKDFDWNSENATLLFQLTSKYGTPYFQNFINSELNPNDVRSMCCRLQLDKRELRKRGGGLFGADEFTGSIGVVTINMPRIGYLATDEENYFARLENLMCIAKNSLERKRKIVKKLMNQGLFPYTKRYLKHFNNHFSTIGILGMHESCLNFLGKSIGDIEGVDFSKKVLTFMRDKLISFQESTGNLYNLEATPAESTSYRLAQIDNKMHPGIIQSGNDETFYTNSTQLPVDYTEDLFEALTHQEKLQSKYTGGTVFHTYLGESLPDMNSCRTLVKQIVNNFRLPYISISPTFSVCNSHGRVPGKHETCPSCGNEMEIYSRITGYYRPIKNWNDGKKEEFKHRKNYLVEKNFNKVKFFFGDNCSKCVPIKDFLTKKQFSGEYINITTDEGYREAEKFNIKAIPTFLVNKNGKNNIYHDLKGVREWMNTGS